MGKTRHRKKKKSRKRRRTAKGGTNQQTVVTICKLLNELTHDDDFTDDESDSEYSPNKGTSADKALIGKGYFSDVFFCKETFAVKFSSYSTYEGFTGETEEEFVIQMSNEANIQNILALVQISIPVIKTGTIREDKKLLYYTVMDRAYGDLCHFINAVSKVKYDIDIKQIITRIFALYERLHMAGYIHGDIRPGNIVYKLNDSNNLNDAIFYIIDFGFTSPVLKDDPSHTQNEMKRLDKMILTPIIPYLEEKKRCDTKKAFL
jgi:serine/threonine protein kinase